MLTHAEADYISDHLPRYYWVRSNKGNLWHELHDGTRLTVFRRKANGRYAYCINRNGQAAVFSYPIYRTEQEAKEAVLDVVNHDRQ